MRCGLASLGESAKLSFVTAMAGPNIRDSASSACVRNSNGRASLTLVQEQSPGPGLGKCCDARERSYALYRLGGLHLSEAASLPHGWLATAMAYVFRSEPRI